jgi:hypothetical protein
MGELMGILCSAGGQGWGLLPANRIKERVEAGADARITVFQTGVIRTARIHRWTHTPLTGFVILVGTKLGLNI